MIPLIFVRQMTESLKEGFRCYVFDHYAVKIKHEKRKELTSIIRFLTVGEVTLGYRELKRK